MTARIAYFINQYPKVSHSFIRREILALETRGFTVQRIALRGWDSEQFDPADLAEQKRTEYLLKGGVAQLLGASVKAFFNAPRRFMSALLLSMQMSRHAEKSLPFHLIYLAEACRMLPLLRAFGASHVHAHFGTNSAEVVMLAQALGGPGYSFTAHGCEEFDKPEFIGLGEKIRRASFVVAISSFGRSQLYRWVEHSHWPKVKVVHCGIDAAFHQVDPVPPSARARLVCVGRLCKEKGQLMLLEATALLARRGVQFELVLAGDGEMRGDVEAFIDQNGLRQCVRITGWISGAEVRQEILEARALVVSSFAEGLPVVIMEAMALRRPVLSTAIAGIPELVRHGESGWLYPPGAVDELAGAMNDCLISPVSHLAEMGNRAYDRVLERHSVDTEVAKLALHFERALGISAA